MKEFAKEIPTDVKVCYIAIMPIDGHYDLEVEVDHGTIGGVYQTGYKTTQVGLAKARLLADELDEILTARGVKVCKTRKEWDDVSFPVHW